MTVAALRQSRLFHGMPDAAIADLVEVGRARRFRAGRVLMRQGEPSDVMYVIVKGAVRVERTHPDLKEPVLLGVLGRGEVVGEMGILDGEPRSATVTAEMDTTAMQLTAGQLAAALAAHPALATALLHIMSRRIRDTDMLLGEIAAGRVGLAAARGT